MSDVLMDLFEAIKEEINSNIALLDQCVSIDGYTYYFEEVYEDGWDDCGKYSDSFTIYRVAKWTNDGEFIEDLDMLIRQDCMRCGSYFSYYEYEFDEIYLVEEKEETITRKYWARID